MSKRSTRRAVSAMVSLIILGLAFASQQGWIGNAKQAAEQSQPGLYTIDHFVDGDTIAVKMSDGTETIRMIGIDTPETHKPHTPVQCYGPAAAAFTKSLIGTNQVRLASDPKSTNRDRYNRLLRYVYLPDGKMVETELIKNGYGFAYTSFPFTRSGEFVNAQEQAKSASKGLWTNCQPFQEANGRWQTENQS